MVGSGLSWARRFGMKRVDTAKLISEKARMFFEEGFN